MLEVIGQLFRTDLAIYGNIGLHLVAVLPSSRCPVVQDIDQSLGPGVDTEFCIYREECVEPASSYVVKNLESDSRTVISSNTLSDIEVHEFKRVAEALGRDGFWYHFEGRVPDVTLPCMRYLREAWPGAKISVEIENFPSEGLQELVPEVDAAFYSKTWALPSSVGAGDAFITGMLYSYIAHPKHWSLQKRLQFSNRLAGYKVVQEGFSGLGHLIRRAY
ncbi:unnamed protein product, partial [Clonostachys solani]